MIRAFFDSNKKRGAVETRQATFFSDTYNFDEDKKLFKFRNFFPVRSGQRRSDGYRVALQLVREVLAVLDQVAALPAGDADAVVAGELVLRAGGQGQVEPGGGEQVAAGVSDQPRVPANRVADLAGGVGPAQVPVLVAGYPAGQFPVSASLFGT